MEKLYLSLFIILMIAGWLKAELCGIPKRFEKIENGIFLICLLTIYYT
jgi:hypothetical protein